MKTNHRPLVSVIIPTYHAAWILGACLEALRKQTYSAIEIIIVDNFSGDGTEALAKKYEARFYAFDGLIDKARNFGAEKAGGAYLPILTEYPPVRKRFILEDSGAAVLLTTRSLIEEDD